MKKILSILMVIIMLAATLASCGEPAETTDAPETEPSVTDAPDAPATDAPVTEAPVTDAPESEFVVPDDPVFDENEEEKKNYVFNYDFSGGVKQIENYNIKTEGWDYVADGGYIKNSTDNAQLAVTDSQLFLSGKSFVLEVDLSFDELPHIADGVTNFPLSIISWIRKTNSSTFYDWVFKLDNDGFFYVKDTSTKTEVKIDANKKYTIGLFFDDKNSQSKIMVDGEVVGVRSLASRDEISSVLRVFDSGKEKAHFKAKVYGVRAYLADEKELLKDAERDIFTALKETVNPTLCFVGYTDKDALSYKVGEEMKFDIYLTCNGEVVSAPYFYYSIEGEDGQKKTDGYLDGSKGHITVTGKMSKAGALRVKVYVCDENKNKQTKNNSNLYVDLETSTPQKSDLMFKGGAIAGLEEIQAGGKRPSDLVRFWNGVVSDCYNGDIKLLRFEELKPEDFGGSSSKHSLYLFEIECAGGFSTGYLTIPKEKTSVGIGAKFVSYGAAKKPSPSFDSSNAIVSICAHSYHLDDPNASVVSNYGFNNAENQNRDTVYFKNMIIRDIIATRFLKAYVGDSSYGKIVFEGKTISPLKLWKKGDAYSVNGGSQASFQSVAVAALDEDVTKASFGVPWFCDIGGDLVGRFDGWNPDYTDALMYYDSCSLATLIQSDVKVTINAGLGDTTSEPSGVVALYNALKCPVTMSMYQNREHTYNPPLSVVYKISKSAA